MEPAYRLNRSNQESTVLLSSYTLLCKGTRVSGTRIQGYKVARDTRILGHKGTRVLEY